jgi:NitT/TauT family transport system substrate-binding protein
MRGLQQAVAALRTAGAADPVDARSGYRHGLRLDQSLLNQLEAQSRWAQREGLVPDGPPPDFLKLMRPQVLAQIDPARVTLVSPGVR